MLPIVGRWKALHEAGHLEAYTWFVLGPGDEAGFVAWKEAHEAPYAAMLKWLRENPFPPPGPAPGEDAAK